MMILARFPTRILDSDVGAADAWSPGGLVCAVLATALVTRTKNHALCRSPWQTDERVDDVISQPPGPPRLVCAVSGRRASRNQTGWVGREVSGWWVVGGRWVGG